MPMLTGFVGPADPGPADDEEARQTREIARRFLARKLVRDVFGDRPAPASAEDHARAIVIAAGFGAVAREGGGSAPQGEGKEAADGR